MGRCLHYGTVSRMHSTQSCACHPQAPVVLDLAATRTVRAPCVAVSGTHWWWVLVLVFLVDAGTTGASAEEGIVNTIAVTASQPRGVHIDPATGVVLFTEEHSVRRILTNGTVELVAGSGATGSTNSVGAAATFNNPRGIAAGVQYPNRAYVADHNNDCLRDVNLATHMVTTFAGACGTGAFQDGIGADARFFRPAGIVLFYNTTSGVDVCLYVADVYNYVIRRVEIATATVATFAGSAGNVGASDGHRIEAALFNYPYDVAVDATGRWVFVADTHNQCIRRIAASGMDGVVSTVAGLCGSATGLVDGMTDAARFKFPYGLTINPSGSTLYVSDSNNCAIRRLDLTTGSVTTLSGGLGCSGTGLVDGPLSTARFNYPAIPYCPLNPTGAGGGTIETVFVVADTGNLAIRRVVLRDVAASTTSTTPSLPSMSATASTRSKGSDSGTPSTTIPSTVSGSLPTRGNASTTESRTASGTVSGSIQWTRSPSSSATASSSWMASSSRTASATIPSTVSDSRHSRGNASVTESRITASMACSASDTATTSNSATQSGSDASAPWSASWSVTASDSSWACGAYDPRNVSLVEVTPSSMLEAVSSGRTVLSVTVADEGTATPLPRIALLTTRREDTPLLLLGLSLQWAGAAQWGIVSAVSVQHGDEALTFHATATRVPGSTVDGASYEIAVLLWPPSSSQNGWVAAGLEAVYTATEVVLELGLACAAEGGNTSGVRAAMVRVKIPAPGHPRELAEKVETTATVAQWTTAVGGPGAGSAVGRVGAVRSMGLCGDGDGASGGGLVGVKLGCGDDGRSVVKSAARGAVVSNAGILCGCVALVVLLAALYSAAMRVAFAKAALRLAAPSVLLPMWIATLPSTSAGAMELLITSDKNSSTSFDCPWDIAAAVLGVIVCAAPSAWICFVWLRLVRLLGLHVAELPAARRLPDGRLGWLRDAVRVRMRWVVHRGATTKPSTLTPAIISAPSHDVALSPAPARHALVLLHEYRVLWYAALDAGVLVAAGVLSALSGAGSNDLCVGAAASVCALYAAQLIVCAAARPFTTRYAFVHALMTLTLSAASVGLQTAAIAEASKYDNLAALLERREVLARASAVCDLFVIGISAVRVAFDVIECCKGVASVAKEVSCSRSSGGRASSMGADATVAAAVSSAVPVVPHQAVRPVLPGAEDDEDLLFWDEAGNALQPQEGDGEADLQCVATTAAINAVDGDSLRLPPLQLHHTYEDTGRQTVCVDGSDEAAAYAALQLSPPPTAADSALEW